MKQTAVEFLMDKRFDQSTMVTEQMQWFEQAKQMEKEQIIDAFIVSYTGTAEEYYNETYNTTER